MPKALLLMFWNWVLSQLQLPDPHDGASVRAWLQKLVALVEPLIEMVPWPKVKLAFDALTAMLKCNDCWAKLWALVDSLIEDNQKVVVFGADGRLEHTESAADFAELYQMAQARGAEIDPNTLLMLIQVIVKLIQGWRNR